MNKITIIILFLAFSSTVIFTELAFQDYLGKLYPSYEKELSAKASSSYKSLEELFKSQSESSKDTSTPKTEAPQTTSALSGALQIATNASDTKEESASKQEAPEVADADLILQKDFLSSLLNVKLVEREFNQQLFSLINIDSADYLYAKEFAYQNDDKDYIVLNEIQLQDYKNPSNYFAELKAIAESLPEVETNQTDAFFDQSFYLNNKTKTQQVYLIGIKDSKIITMYYYKNFHQRFKVQFGN